MRAPPPATGMAASYPAPLAAMLTCGPMRASGSRATPSNQNPKGPQKAEPFVGSVHF